ncbi:MAG TPA: ketopantoate reductase C-terminal domain-containing protein, partial [Acidobacteriota bacterium]|nr:ketopantoate reductase C-terminal domain-containing protein [Acidobacteriota bacterium]
LGFFDIRVQVESMVRNHGSTAAVLVDTPEHERSYPSTWQDLRLDRPVTEVEWLNGEIVRLGKQFGVPTPCNSVLREGVLASVRDHSGPGKYTLIQLLTAIEDEQRRSE